MSIHCLSISVIALALLSACSSNQALVHAQANRTIRTDPDSFLVGRDSLPSVLLVGSWHFNYPGIDAHKISEEDKVNILSPRRQAELSDLLDYIARFKPTKIAVEGGRNSGYILRRFEAWKKEGKALGASETDQIALRLLDRFKLDTLYGVDAYPLLLELATNRSKTADSTYLDRILARHYFGGRDSISQRYQQLYSYQDRQQTRLTLLESFRYINSEKVLNRGFGSYIGGGQFDAKRYEGADALSMFWFNRNLRIYRNIQNIITSPRDRVLVLFGAGHVSILNYLFACSPQYKYIRFNDL